jgi:hypothetical protein
MLHATCSHHLQKSTFRWSTETVDAAAPVSAAASLMTTPLSTDSTVVAGKLKENARTKTTGRSGKEKESGKSKGPVKTKLPAEVVKKPFKVIVRKLPVRDFNVDDFGESIKRVLLQLGYGTSLSGDESAKDVDKELIRIEHFIEGKLR